MPSSFYSTGIAEGSFQMCSAAVTPLKTMTTQATSDRWEPSDSFVSATKDPFAPLHNRLTIAAVSNGILPYAPQEADDCPVH